MKLRKPTEHNIEQKIIKIEKIRKPTWWQDLLSNPFCNITDAQINQSNLNKYRVLCPN